MVIDKMRRSGILLPISALPSKYGIGAFSKEAYEFVDFLKEAGQSLWQILPLGPTGYGDSPYQTFSTFAGNPYYIDLTALIEAGWLTEEECASVDFISHPRYVEYEKIYKGRFPLFRLAYERSGIEKDADYQAFVRENADWLEDYALYMAIKDARKGASYLTWEDGLKKREEDALAAAREEYKDEVGCYCFMQYLFATQWKELKNYANENGIEILGDIPIYVAPDGADTWSHPELFQLDEECVPKAVAGCPPDAFSATGQLWGNPLYDWPVHKKSGYAWWMRRLQACFEMYDIVRIDHFRGFESYYSIPYGDATAENGHWEKGPDYDLFRVMKETLGDKAVVAEDLGYLTPAVYELVAKVGYPGMKVLQFAFESGPTNEYLPHNHIKNCVVYTGTHDNQTSVGWVGEMSDETLEYVREYLDVETNEQIPAAMVRAAIASAADTTIIPMQDWLGAGPEARINMPSTLGDNWKWRLGGEELTEELAHKIRHICEIYGR